MVCLFCNYGHESEECDKYKTDEARKKTESSNRFCFTCRLKSDVAHLPADKECPTNKKCIGWFSTEHHKLFCAERIKSSNFFLPRIDQNLLQRFLEMFDMDEKYSIILSSPTAVNSICPLKSIKIWDSFKNDEKLSKFNVVVGSLILNNLNMEKDKKLFDSIKSKVVICLARYVKIEKSHLSPEMIFHLLSPYTKVFQMYSSSCTPNISFTDIIKNGANLEKIWIYDWETNIIYEKTWIEDLLKFGKNLTSLYVEMDTVEFDVENFVKFVENFHIEIWYNLDLLNEDVIDLNASIFRGIDKRLSEYFEYLGRAYSHLRIGFAGVDGYSDFSLDKIKPQKRILPTRATTKRNYK